MRAIFIVLIIILTAIVIALKKTIARHERPYKAMPLLTNTEQNFYQALKAATSPNIHICPKVRLRDLVEITYSRQDRRWWQHHGAITQKHVDFVLCDRADLKVLAVVELNDSTHLRRARQERDELVAKVLQSAGIRLINIPARRTYNSEDLATTLAIENDSTRQLA